MGQTAFSKKNSPMMPPAHNTPQTVTLGITCRLSEPEIPNNFVE